MQRSDSRKAFHMSWTNLTYVKRRCFYLYCVFSHSLSMTARDGDLLAYPIFLSVPLYIIYSGVNYLNLSIRLIFRAC
jgi:hypothetical protein